MTVQGGLFQLKWQLSVASETFSGHSLKEAEMVSAGEPLADLWKKVSQMLFEIELKHLETLWPVQFQEKKILKYRRYEA